MESTEETGWLNNRIGDLFYLLHVAITLFCAFAWLGPDEWMWWGVFILYGATEILWLLRDDYCIITDIERLDRVDNILHARLHTDLNGHDVLRLL